MAEFNTSIREDLISLMNENQAMLDHLVKHGIQSVELRNAAELHRRSIQELKTTIQTDKTCETGANKNSA